MISSARLSVWAYHDSYRQALGSAEDPELLKETFKFISTKARDQDVVYFFRGLSGNPKARRLLAQYFKEEYDALYKRFEATFTLKSLVEVRIFQLGVYPHSDTAHKLSMGTLSTEKDRVEIVEFFQVRPAVRTPVCPLIADCGK